MKYLLALLLTVFQSAIVAFTSWLLVLGPLILVWFVESDGSLELSVVARIAVYTWLSAHGVPIQVAPGEMAGIEFGAFTFTGLPFGYSLFIFLLLGAFGHRLSALPVLWPSWLVGTAAYSGIGFATYLLSLNAAVSAADWQVLLLPASWFLLVVAGTSLLAPRFELIRGSAGAEAVERVWFRTLLAGWKARLHWSIRSLLAPAVRGGLMVMFLMLATVSLWLSIQLAASWLEVIRLYESLQLSALGVLLVTMVQLFLLPNLIAWGVAWLSGIGFAIGAGSSLSPLGSQVGPLPALPIFAALPDGESSSILSILIPIACAFLATLLMRRHSTDMRWEYATRTSAAAALALGMATVAAFGVALIVAVSSGGFGPGRLESVGADPLLVFLAIWLQVFLGSLFAGFLVLNPVSDRRSRRS